MSLYSEKRQFTETLLSLFIRCSVPGVVLIVSIHDICLLPYFLYSHEYRLTRNTVYCAILSDQIVVDAIRCAYFILTTKLVGKKKAFALDNTAYQEGNQKERQFI